MNIFENVEEIINDLVANGKEDFEIFASLREQFDDLHSEGINDIWISNKIQDAQIYDAERIEELEFFSMYKGGGISFI